MHSIHSSFLWQRVMDLGRGGLERQIQDIKHWNTLKNVTDKYLTSFFIITYFMDKRISVTIDLAVE